MRVDQVLDRLEAVTGHEPQWSARCPAHEDRHASLSIGIGRDGRILLTCHAGCDLAAITHAMGIEERDLFADASERERAKLTNGGSAPWGDRPLDEAVLPMGAELARHVEALRDNGQALGLVWDRKGWQGAVLARLGVGLVGDRVGIPVRDVEGKLVNHLRYRPDAQPKMLAAPGRPRTPLYLLVKGAAVVWLVEGETDAISLAMLGLSVIGAPGASAKARPEWLEPVRGRHVVVCFDSDEPGRRAAKRWATVAASRGALSVRVLDLGGAAGNDVGNLVRDGREELAAVRTDLLARARTLPPYDPAVGDVVLPLAQPPDDSAEAQPGDLVLTRLSDLQVQRVRWLWRQRIPAGRVGIVYGPPGQGKSTLIARLAGEVTREGKRVLIASAEDDPLTTLLPRAQAAGAVPSLVELMETKAAKGTTSLVLPRDLEALGARMRDHALLVIDPFAAHLGDDVNAWSEQSVRAQVLAPLAWYARLTGCTVVLVMHMNKSDKGDALARISGSGGFGGAARFVLLLGLHPDDLGLDDEAEQRLVLVHVKASEGRRQRAMVFRRDLAAVEVAGEEEPVAMPVLELVTDNASIDADQVLAVTDPDERGAYTEAVLWLRRELGTGPQLAKRLIGQARERGDFSERTLRKAKRALGVRSERETEGWFWVLEPPS